jgi:hypothetical protein
MARKRRPMGPKETAENNFIFSMIHEKIIHSFIDLNGMLNISMGG